MEFNKVLVQQILDRDIPNYIISTITDTEKYVFVSYKHKDYENDDPRGHLVGVGPIVYNKQTEEYKILGSGEYILGDYREYLTEIEDVEFSPPSLDDIKNRIVRRNYVNDDDIFDLAYLKDDHGSISYNKFTDYKRFVVYDAENSQTLLFISDFFKNVGHDHEIIFPNRIIVERERKE